MAIDPSWALAPQPQGWRGGGKGSARLPALLLPSQSQEGDPLAWASPWAPSRCLVVVGIAAMGAWPPPHPLPPPPPAGRRCGVWGAPAACVPRGRRKGERRALSDPQRCIKEGGNPKPTKNTVPQPLSTGCPWGQAGFLPENPRISSPLLSSLLPHILSPSSLFFPPLQHPSAQTFPRLFANIPLGGCFPRKCLKTTAQNISLQRNTQESSEAAGNGFNLKVAGGVWGGQSPPRQGT